MSNGKLALVPYIETRPQGVIGKKAHLEIQKIKMSREERLEQEELEEMAK